jgi:hypothetical protein
LPTEEVAFEADVFLLRKAAAEALKEGGPTAPAPGPEPMPGSVTHLASEPEPTAATRTLRLVGSVPPEVWNRLGTKVLPKLRSSSELRIGLELSVTVSADSANGLAAELRQILHDLGLADALRME